MHLNLQRSNKAIARNIHLSNERVPRASPKLIKIHTKILIRGGIKMVDPIKCSRDKIYKKEHLIVGKANRVTSGKILDNVQSRES